MNDTANHVRIQVLHLQRLVDHALPRKGAVAVDQYTDSPEISLLLVF